MNSEYGTWFDNYEEFATTYPEIAAALLDEVGEGDWQDEELYYYDSIEDFANYELCEGWYADLDLNRDFRGAPNPLNYIDLQALGEALLNTGDSSVQWTDWNCVVTTSYGW